MTVGHQAMKRWAPRKGQGILADDRVKAAANAHVVLLGPVDIKVGKETRRRSCRATDVTTVQRSAGVCFRNIVQQPHVIQIYDKGLNGQHTTCTMWHGSQRRAVKILKTGVPV
ncbi:hypothetical protein E4U22_006160 [Claviceps purpurea]|nr:hypothetical protein E4U22_006160 [Claviceps purpurea]